MPIRRTLAPFAIAAGLVAVAACSGSPGTTIDAGAPAPAAAPAVAPAAAPAPRQTSPGSIVQVAQSAGQFNTLVTALQAAGLVSTLEGPGPFTVFAPTDAAFAKIPSSTLNALLADKDQLTKVLTYHVVPGKVMASQISNGQSVATVEGQPVTFTVAGSSVKVNDATVVQADVAASNGVIHAIDTVLMPPAVTMPETR
jgi:uncharacterized surface protein with fasciclin (FAS1) repeats